jgi:hypothetical protein
MGPCSMDLNGKIYSQQFVGLRICGERERERERDLEKILKVVEFWIQQ